jgi:L-ascorbate metabolism protein UlaG (beta-lactamase superfamily)
MEISWLGHSCFRLRGRDAAVLTDPCPPTTGYKIGKVNANVVTISHDHPESSYRQAVAGAAKFVTGPGEYEISGVLITGIRTFHDKTRGGEIGRNVTFVIDLDDVRVCHLGDLGHLPNGDDVELLSGADVLLIPVGGHSTIDSAAAAEIVSMLEPRIVIPMQYRTEASLVELDPLDRFLKEMGAEGVAVQQRLSVTRSTLPHDTAVVPLEYRGQ